MINEKDELYKNEFIQTEFLSAINNDDLEKVKSLKNETKHLINEGFVHASLSGKLKFIKYFLSEGADINYNNDYALTMAVESNSLDILKYLLSKGAKISVDDEGRTIFSWAALWGKLEILKYLFEEHYEEFHKEKDLALIYASSKNRLKVVSYLLKNGANIHTEYDYAFISACDSSSLETMKYLMDNGADIHAQEDMALMSACYQYRMKVVDFLLKNGCYSVEQKEKCLETAVNMHILETVKYFIVDQKCDIEIVLKNKKASEEVIDWCKKYMNSKKLTAHLESNLNENQKQKLKNKI